MKKADYKLTKEEKKLLQSIENDEWKSVKNLASEKERFQSIAKSSGVKDKRVNLRLTTRDFELAHIRALEQGIPYQTLLSSVIHKYLTGQMQDKSA